MATVKIASQLAKPSVYMWTVLDPPPAGIEPSDDIDATEYTICNCEKCQECRAAYALHRECFKSHYLATLGNN
jgi:hypothetical protein